MSSSIWTRCGEKANLRRLGGRVWRVVEAQHVTATRKLVDTLEQQETLERLIDGSKPAAPTRAGARPLHYLLFTPFRYPPLGHGSRFGSRADPSLWYGSSRPRTAFAECAYYRLLFLEGTTADLGSVAVDLSLFDVTIATRRGVDLTRPPFDAHRAAIASPTDYAGSRSLGRAMREAGVEAFRYPSARDARGGVNVALFTPAPFAGGNPGAPETWHSVTSRRRVEFVKKDVFERRSFVFAREEFEVAGRLPAPAL
ncbi:MAG TPA: RES family NAD+ phosphorylase [Candidatus Polarisedimenticolaceae bacterium]|nr:RES family NAD+ phosphorylase [Candidatus Polarisedimenticolaceae bacterium]